MTNPAHTAAFATAHGGCAIPSTAPRTISSIPECASAANPVDLVHLSRQSLGDRALEMEILELFRNQSNLYLDRLENGKSASVRKLAAHTILGSARGIGAWRVAREAEKVEMNCEGNADLGELGAAIAEANAYIAELMA